MTVIDCNTLVALLRYRASTAPDRRAYTFLLDGEDAEQHLSYAELDRRARAIGAVLLRRGGDGARGGQGGAPGRTRARSRAHGGGRRGPGPRGGRRGVDGTGPRR